MKMSSGCIRCGYAEHPAALDFSHRAGSAKAFNVSADPKRAWSSVQAEISKCVVLCANCHRVETYEGRHWHALRGRA